jgi:CHAD domain-containing protein
VSAVGVSAIAKGESRGGREPFSEAALGLSAEPVVARAKDPVPEHVRAALDLRLRAMLRHEPGTRSGADPEDLHQMRVSVRRMRAVLRAARPLLYRKWADGLRAELGWLGGVLGPVRDLDVLLERLHEEAAEFPPDEREAADALVAGLFDERVQVRKEMLEALDGPRYAALVTTLARATQAPLPTASATKQDGGRSLVDLVRAQHRKLDKAVKRIPEQEPDEELHALRIRGKRVRYSAELVDLARPAKKTRERIRRLLGAVVRFQDVLGEHQDACVAQQRVRQLLGQQTDADLAFVAGRLVEREQARRAASRDQWRTAWQAVNTAANAAL